SPTSRSSAPLPSPNRPNYDERVGSRTTTRRNSAVSASSPPAGRIGSVVHGCHERVPRSDGAVQDGGVAVPQLVFSQELRRLGGSPRHLERAAAAGSLIRVRPGVFSLPSEWASATIEEQHLARVRAVASTSKRPLVFSHASAAVLQGVGIVDTPLARPHITQPPRLEVRLVGVVAHRADLDAAEIVEVDGLRVTSLERTALDIA